MKYIPSQSIGKVFSGHSVDSPPGALSAADGYQDRTRILRCETVSHTLPQRYPVQPQRDPSDESAFAGGAANRYRQDQSTSDGLYRSRNCDVAQAKERPRQCLLLSGADDRREGETATVWYGEGLSGDIQFVETILRRGTTFILRDGLPLSAEL